MNKKLPLYLQSCQYYFKDNFKALLPLISLIIFFAASTPVFAQGGGGTCADIQPFCAGNDALIFANCNDQDPNCTPDAEPGPDYGCLFSQPYPAWFFLQIDNPGTLSFQIVQNTAFDGNGNPIGTGLDVDFICWGPFEVGDNLCDYSQLQSFNEIGCSFSIDPIENFTIPNAQTGEIYVLVITNFAQDPGFIKLEQVAGNGSTNCDIVFDCSVTINEDDQLLCDVPEFQLTTTITGPVESYEWYRDGVLIPGETDDNLLVTETGNYEVIANGTDCSVPVSDDVNITLLFGGGCTVEPICEGVDFEENFGTGTGRVSTPFTNYIFNGTTQVEDGEYTISNTSAGLNTGWFTDMEDHTEGDVDGRMLFVNASFAPDEFYRRTITLDQNIEYTFNAWITTVYDTDTNICGGNSIPSNVIFRIEDPSGNLIAETNTGDIPNGPDPNWQEFAIVFNTGANTDIQLVLINNADGGCGNDLAIDDITLSLENQQPEIVTPPDLSTCDADGNGTEIFNLEDQIPTILNGQDPALFNVSFHNTQFEAEANQNPIATPNAYSNISNPETIYVRVEKVAEPTCFNTVSFQLILSDIEDLTGNLPAEVILCLGDDFPLLDATPSNPNIDLTLVTYEWTDGGGTVVSTDATYTPTAAGTYNVKVTYPPCSEQTFSVDIIVNDPPIVDLGEDEILCNGSSFEIVPVITGASPAITYLWSTGETTPTITVSQSGTYTLTVTDGPCTASDSIDIIISDPVIVDLGEDFVSCFDTDTILTAQVVGNPQTAMYEWYFNGILLSGENNQTLFIAQEGEYTVIVTVDSCVGQDSVVVSLRDDLEVSVGEDFITCPNDPQTITASTTEEGVTYQWFLNGNLITGETNSNLEISLEPGLIGVQTYSVVITLGSCSATDAVDVSSYDVGNCVISEGISPNGDGFNDSLDLTFLNDRTGVNKLQIFNRLGTLVFEKNNYINEWFGQTNDGNDLPTGTYFYVIDLAGNDAVYGSQATGWIYLNQKAN